MAVLCVSGSGPYYILALHNGNAHLLVIFMLYGSLMLYLKERTGWSALLMASAITFKVFPILLLPYFAVKKRWKYLFQTGVPVLLLNLAPALYFGWGGNLRLLEQWHGLVIANQEFHEIHGPINLSLKGQLRRYISEVDYRQRVSGDVNYPSINIAAISAGSVDLIWLVTALIVSSSVLWSIHRAGRGDEGLQDGSRRNERTIVELGLMICLMLFVGPQTNKLYFIALLWPISALVLGCRRYSNGYQAIRAALLLVALMSLCSSILPIRNLSRLVLAIGVDFYLNLLVMASLGILLYERTRNRYRER